MSLLDLPEGELAAVVSAACRTARYDEYLALTESAMEDYEDWNDRVRWLEGGDRAVGVQARDEAAARVSLYAGVAAAYRPTVDVDQLAAKVAEKLEAAQAARYRAQLDELGAVPQSEPALRDRIQPGWWRVPRADWSPELIAEANRRRAGPVLAGRLVLRSGGRRVPHRGCPVSAEVEGVLAAIVVGIPARVEAGARWLDVHRPDWLEQVDLSELSMESSCRCVLGQVYGAYGWAPPEAYATNAIDLGFHCTLPNPEEFDEDDLGEIADDEYTALTAEWSRLIERRRAVSGD